MLGLIWRVLVGRFGCEHKWALLHEVRMFRRPSDEIPEARQYILQCERCGDIKRRQF